MSEQITDDERRENRPLYTMVAGVALIALAVVGLILIPEHRLGRFEPLLVLVIASAPGLIAAGYAERTSRDVRNGVVQRKAREGAVEALQQTGVTDVVDATGRGATTVASLAALGRLTDSDPQKRDALAKILDHVMPPDTSHAVRDPEDAHTLANAEDAEHRPSTTPPPSVRRLSE